MRMARSEWDSTGLFLAKALMRASTWCSTRLVRSKVRVPWFARSVRFSTICPRVLFVLNLPNQIPLAGVTRPSTSLSSEQCTSRASTRIGMSFSRAYHPRGFQHKHIHGPTSRALPPHWSNECQAKRASNADSIALALLNPTLLTMATPFTSSTCGPLTVRCPDFLCLLQDNFLAASLT